MKNAKKNVKLPLAILFLLAGVVLVFAAAVFHRPISILLYALGGFACGLGSVAVAMTVSDRRRTEEERRAAAIGETDERNIAIREKAAMSTWYWTLYLLWGLFLVFMVMDGTIYAALLSLALVCHSVFYFVNIHRWAKKM